MNVENSLGSGGRIAIAFYYLMKELWMGKVSGSLSVLIR